MKLTRRGIFGVIAAAMICVGAIAIGVVLWFPLSPKHKVTTPSESVKPATAARVEASSALTESDMLKCNRKSQVYSYTAPPEPPPLPFPSLRELPVGSSGYIGVLVSIHGKIYANATTLVSPRLIKYRENANQAFTSQTFDVHIKLLAGGIAVDCETPAFISASESDYLLTPPGQYYIPVVSMFSKGQEVGRKN